MALEGITDDEIREIHRLKDSPELTRQQIADAFGISKTEVQRIIKPDRPAVAQRVRRALRGQNNSAASRPTARRAQTSKPTAPPFSIPQSLLRALNQKKPPLTIVAPDSPDSYQCRCRNEFGLFNWHLNTHICPKILTPHYHCRGCRDMHRVGIGCPILNYSCGCRGCANGQRVPGHAA